MVGAAQVARAEPDGHTLLSILTTHAIAGALMKLPYDSIRDFAPVAAMSVAELGMGVHPSVPASNLKEFIAWGKSLPQPLTYAWVQESGPTASRDHADQAQATASLPVGVRPPSITTS